MNYLNLDLRNKHINETLSNALNGFLQAFVPSASNAHLDSDYIYKMAILCRPMKKQINKYNLLDDHFQKQADKSMKLTTLDQVASLHLALAVNLFTGTGRYARENRNSKAVVMTTFGLLAKIDHLAQEHVHLRHLFRQINSNHMSQILQQMEDDWYQKAERIDTEFQHMNHKIDRHYQK